MITLKQLNVFTVIVQERSITAAADKLCLTKAAVSMALAELERHLEQPLFDRVNNRLMINPAGELLLPHAHQVLDRCRFLESLFKESERLYGEIKIGASDTLGNHLLPPMLAAFQQQTGHTQQQLFITNTAKVCAMLRDYELDIGFVEGRVIGEDLDIMPWFEDEMCIVSAMDCAITDFQTLIQSQSRWLLREQGSGSREFFLANIAAQLTSWRTAFELNSTEAIINGVAAGLGVACISKYSAEHAIAQQRIQALSGLKAAPRQFWLVTRKDKFQSPILTRLIDFAAHWR
ncbi:MULTISPECIES: LysR family transcriptional regulator [Pseudoalteromonas]|uniref:LysR family transcriptional regulator n=1 Tax=Pseudoalteromonas maricaloris TaxID=184924 RepID=A0A8I2H2V7_9GAMM|nr:MULTISPECIES: LysR family transcriptional regulator [Pseudoalteromonas]KID33085.1 XRE family transcriptional regulator [Pseudoalteromonas flavipulchra NCIMB 2033 = ATCC BAA-314]MBD0781253.1 LysR family transcriptional regulator [Pseudoalteromonas flavipulchra]NLR20094.1 LysR family transcriptional regulator [Pseudoalteromonas maricaloris]RZG16864.1 LysR family transcriptional regulator [Pseudoalteromonas sp. CO342X]WOX27319.1 LysR family transcriptional regulator [Pseudoalteromonas maricalo